MKKYCIIAVTALVLNSCSNNSTHPTTTAGSDKKADSFFPVTSFIKGQILILDSLPVTPLQITIRNKKIDSAWLTKKDLKPLLLPFLTPVITETSLTSYFKETRFNDQTINSITFTYDPAGTIPDSITLRHWDIYIDPDKGNVVKVYMVKEIKEKNQLFTQQLTWQTNKLARITTILNKPGGELELLKEDVFKWSFEP